MSVSSGPGKVQWDEAGVTAVVGQVLDISKHENLARAPQSQTTGRTARLYRFPAGKCVPVTPVPAPAAPSVAAPVRGSHLRMHLMVEISIGIVLWLAWFIWHLMH